MSGVAAVLLAASALAGCGSGSSATAQDPAQSNTPTADAPTSGPADPTTSSAPTSPACAKVWKSGARLPAHYRGCAAATGWVKADPSYCEDGHRLVTFAHRFWAAPGRTISRAATTLATDQDFQHTRAACGA
jgi:hypothetical protein